MGGSTYDAMDMTTISNATSKVMQDLGTNTLFDATQMLNNEAKYNRYKDVSSEIINSLAVRMENDKAYQTSTDMLAAMNESYNANRYIMKALEKESGRVRAMDKDTQRSIYRLRNENMSLTYMLEYYQQGSAIVIWSLFMLMLALVPAAMWRTNKMPTFIMLACEVVLVLFYLACCIVYSRGRAMLRTEDMTKVYWAPGKAVMASMGLLGNDESCG